MASKFSNKSDEDSDADSLLKARPAAARDWLVTPPNPCSSRLLKRPPPPRTHTHLLRLRCLCVQLEEEVEDSDNSDVDDITYVDSEGEDMADELAALQARCGLAGHCHGAHGIAPRIKKCLLACRATHRWAVRIKQRRRARCRSWRYRSCSR